jgi:hypothetical protein
MANSDADVSIHASAQGATLKEFYHELLHFTTARNAYVDF